MRGNIAAAASCAVVFISPEKMAFICFTPKSAMKKKMRSQRERGEGKGREGKGGGDFLLLLLLHYIRVRHRVQTSSRNGKSSNLALNSAILRPSRSRLSAL